MKRFFRATTRHFGKRGQSGQALVVLAIGFIGLLGFVGIVTDVSLLFIRYSTMRRAIDAASVAAAGQMRRVVDSNPSDTLAQDEADSVANLNLAARQFIELYGLSPTNVLVETCRAQQVRRDPTTEAPMDASGVLLFNSDGTPNPAADQSVVAKYKELCTEDELKLVRVTAQIEAPTVFMRLLGYNSITLTESAISQTAVIDVVLVFDVSESMLNETTYDDWDNIPDPLQPKQGVRYTPPYISYQDIYDEPAFTPPKKNPYSVIFGSSQGWDGIGYTDPAFNLTDSVHGLNYMIRDTNPNPATSRYYHLGDNLESFELSNGGTWVACNPDNNPSGNCTNGTGRHEPREFCQVRAYTPSFHTLGAASVPTWLQNEYSAYYGANVGLQFSYVEPDGTRSTPNIGAYAGFVPMYNYYGCCNDPNGDGNFADLICQPFREARDAAESFLSRLDFLRGDRVAFVTFDRFATVIDPDGGAGPQSAMIETEYDLFDSTSTLIRRGANNVLNSIIGVKTEESTYVDEPNDGDGPGLDGNGTWDKLLDGGTRRTQSEFLSTALIGNIIDNPVYRACPYDKAASYSLWTNAQTMPDGTPRGLYDNLLNYSHTVPSWFGSGGNLFDLTSRSYEFRASCRGTNIGGALAAGSSTLYNTGRREGAVWIMVMLSDGAAGASNVVSRDGTEAYEPLPYNVTIPGNNNNPLNAMGTSGALRNYPLPARTYGAFGLCPYGTAARPGELLSDPENAPPYCLDQNPATRTYCGTSAQNPGTLALDAYTNCVEFYDVDDYARDWADWVGIADLPGATVGTGTGRVTDQLLPTIFTIGFGLNYDSGACSTALADAAYHACQRGITPYNQTFREDYLGEELLRYIADVGDNFQIDNDFWQGDMGTRIANTNWGARGACEEADPVVEANPGGTYQPIAPMTSCGNYFVAANEQELTAVFNEIASRMFTRLSQ